VSKKLAFNPYMPSYEYVPDGEPHIFGDRVYVYGSHDRFNGLNFCLNNYVCWSAPINDLGNWKYEGVIYRREQDPKAPGLKIINTMCAPDMVQGNDGRYYLYYFIGGEKMISVAVCDTPAGKYEFYGFVKYKDGTPIGKKGGPLQFDPGVFKDDDGRLYLYSGFGFKANPIILQGSRSTTEGPMWFELDPHDMLTVISGDDIHYLDVYARGKAKGTPYEKHPFAEASSMRKFNGKYYFIYSSLNSHNLCYAVSDKPTSGFQFGGVLVSCGDIGLPGVNDIRHAHNFTGNTHGSLIELNGKYYVFYHRHSNRKQSSRQACAEQIKFIDGKFIQAEMTSCGLNDGPLPGRGTYPSYIACNLWGKRGTRFYSMIPLTKRGYPYLTQDGKDRNSGEDQYITNLADQSVVGYKYFDLTNTKEISLCIKGKARGVIEILNEEKGNPVATINITPTKEKQQFIVSINVKGVCPLYFKYKGKGRFSLYSLSFNN